MTSLINTRIIKVDPEHPDEKIIQFAAELLTSGRLVAFPTETVYGLGANAFDTDAVEKIFEAKKRPYTDPLIVHIKEIQQIYDVAINIPKMTWLLAEKFWPGPLTLILKRNSKISYKVSTGLTTVAVRMPNHKIPQHLMSFAGVPIAAPSANLFTRPSPTTAEHVYADLKGRVDLILDGGPCTIGLESTVLDLTHAEPVILRPGGYSLEVLKQVVPNIQMKPMFQKLEKSTTPSVSPGTMAKHYSPNAKVLLFAGDPNSTMKRMVRVAHQLISNHIVVGVMVPNENRHYFDGVKVKLQLLGSQDDLEQISHNLFAGMRELDDNGVDVILVRDFEREGLGLAISDRLFRASEGVIISHDTDSSLVLHIKDAEITLEI